MVSITDVVLYRDQIPKAVEPKIEDREALPGAADKITAEGNPVEDKNVILKSANEENQPQENVASLPMEPPIEGKTHLVNKEQKRLSNPYEQVNITT